MLLERNTTYASGSQIKSVDLNAMQDDIAALNRLNLGLPQNNFAGVTFAGKLTVGGQPLVVADFTYTADAATDVLTKVAHGLETGDGPLRTTNSGGALPGGLAINTDYFAIRIGPDTFRVATSRANAVAGVAINITSNGTGTQTLSDVGGTTRVSDAAVTRNLIVDGTATVGGAVSTSGLLTANGGVIAGANQNIAVAGTGLYKRPPRTRHISAHKGVGGGTFSRNGVIVGTFWIPIDVDEGERIIAVAARISTTVVNDEINLLVFRMDHSGAAPLATQLGNTATGGVPNTNSTITVSGLNELVGNQHFYYIAELQQVVGSGGSVRGILVTTEV